MTLEGCFIGRFRGLSAAGELGDEFPAGEVQSLGVFLNFRSFQAHAFTDDQENTATDARFVDVTYIAVSGTLNAFG